MYRIKLVLCTAVLMSLNAISFGINDNKITPSEIKSVKIYTTGAVVTRTAKIVVESGTSSLEFDNLSSSIDKQSVTVTGTGEVTILSVQYNLNYLNEEAKPRTVLVLEDSIKFTTHELAKLDNLESVYNEELSMILSNKSIRNEREGVSAENLKEVADFYRSRLSDIKAKLLDIKDEQTRLKKDKKRINAQLKELNMNRNMPTGTVVVALSAPAKTSVVLEISYLVTSAGWSPLYDIRAKDISSPIQLNYKANVHQSSGEDWKNVKLTLSTGNPTVSGLMPQMYPWHLSFYVPVVMKATESNDGSVRSVASIAGTVAGVHQADDIETDHLTNSTDYLTDSRNSQRAAYGFSKANKEEDKKKSLSEVIVANNNQLSVDFDIAIPYSVPSDGKIYLVDVQHYDMKADYSYHAIPKLDKDAFLIAKITGWEAMNLLSGNANIFFENSFIGSSYLSLQNASDTLDISLGRDKKISINREKLKDFSKNQSLGSNTVKTLTYETTVRNNKTEPITIILDDQMPIADNKDITVKMLENSNAEYNDKTGTLSWKMTVAPSATEKKKLSFTVKYPKDQNVSGL